MKPWAKFVLREADSLLFLLFKEKSRVVSVGKQRTGRGLFLNCCKVRVVFRTSLLLILGRVFHIVYFKTK